MPTYAVRRAGETWYARCSGGRHVMKTFRSMVAIPSLTRALAAPAAALVALAATLGAAPEARADLAPVPAVLQSTCYTCHGANHQAEGSFDLNDSVETLISKGLVVPGDPASSPIYKKISA